MSRICLAIIREDERKKMGSMLLLILCRWMRLEGVSVEGLEWLGKHVLVGKLASGNGCSTRMSNSTG